MFVKAGSSLARRKKSAADTLTKLKLELNGSHWEKHLRNINVNYVIWVRSLNKSHQRTGNEQELIQAAH